ncbi:MAG TPA: SRPBCC family protein [Solirubrobacteraceae bacterium]|nr:SRPBCC family protein [Solirubrobacteraceae bacterium]
MASEQHHPNRPVNGNGSPWPDEAHPASERPQISPLPPALGVASALLGVPQLASPRRFARAIGIEDDDRSVFWTRAVGVRELAAAAGILGLERRRPVRFLWARVAGDVMDLTLLGLSWVRRRRDPGRLAGATGSVLAIMAADIYAAVRLSRGDGETHEHGPRRVAASVTIRRPRQEVYGFWRDFERLPTFMAHIESVRTDGPSRSRWRASAPAGRAVEWDAEVTHDIPGEVIEWRSLSGAEVPNEGSVRFADAPGDRGTEIHLELLYEPPAGKLGVALAKIFGEEPRQQVKDDLRRFKQVMEVGEIVRSDASPEGPLSRRLLRQRPAQPPERPLTGSGMKGGSS